MPISPSILVRFGWDLECRVALGPSKISRSCAEGSVVQRVLTLRELPSCNQRIENKCQQHIAAARKLRGRLDRKDNADKMHLKRSTEFERYVQAASESTEYGTLAPGNGLAGRPGGRDASGRSAHKVTYENADISLHTCPFRMGPRAPCSPWPK